MSTQDEAFELRARPPKIPPLLTSLGVGALVLAMTCGIAWFLYNHAQQAVIAEIRLGLERSSKLAAKRVDGDNHDQLREGSLNSSPQYVNANRDLVQLVEADPDLAYAYTAIELDGKIVLILDTEPPDGPEDIYALAPYEDAPDDLRLAIREQRAVTSTKPYTDQWGTFISSYMPFFNSAGKFSGVVGVDLRLDDYERRLSAMRRAARIAYGLGVALSIFIGWGLWWMYKRDNAMQQLGRQLGNVNALLSVSRALGSNVGLDNLLPVIVGQTTSVMRAERSSLFLYDKTQGMLIGRVTEGMSAGSELLIPADRGIAGRVARTGQVANVANPALDPDFDSAFDKQSGYHTRAILAVPVVDNKGAVLGVLQALNPRDNHPFDDDDIAMLTALAGQAQIALERERLNQSAQLRRKLEDSLKFAQSIQLGMLPHRFPDVAETGVELFARLLPAKMVGGDFYDFPWIDEHRLGLVMADVSGKGVPAALLMAKAMTMIRAYLSAAGNPAEALRRANEELAEDNEAAMFVTAFVAVYDRRSGALTYSNAGHNEPYLVRGKGVIALREACLSPLGTQLGLPFTNARIQMQLSDVLYLYTDGVNEAMDLQYQEYGDERLRNFLIAHAADPAAELAAGSIESVKVHAGEAEQSDDIAVLVMRVRALG